MAPDRLQVVSDVVREGSYALRATVYQGDDPIQASGNRNEMVYVTDEAPGSEYFYKWSTLFPENFASNARWQVFAQWHQQGCCGSPPLEFFVVGEEMFLRVGGLNGKILWRAPLERGRWHDFVLHVKWSSDSREGFVEMYKDGKLAVPQTMAATQFGGDRNYLKLGLYRDSRISSVGVVYHDGFAMGTHLHDVMPPPPEPPAQVAPPAEVTPPVAVAPPAQVTPPAEVPPPAAQVPPTAQQPAPVPQPTGYPPSPAPTEAPPVRTPTPGGSQPGNIEYGEAQGCGSSATGGLPLVAATALLAMALLTRRRHALARSHARKR
jgi:uncharacterized protein (TIGR03382 family)